MWGTATRSQKRMCLWSHQPFMVHHLYEHFLSVLKGFQSVSKILWILLRRSNKLPTTHELRGASGILVLPCFSRHLRSDTCSPLRCGPLSIINSYSTQATWLFRFRLRLNYLFFSVRQRRDWFVRQAPLKLIWIQLLMLTMVNSTITHRVA